MATDAPRQLWPSDKLPYASPFSYAKAIIKEDVTYPIVPNCPIINVDNPVTFDVSSIPVGTFFIAHFQGSDMRVESLCLRVPDDTTNANRFDLGSGFISIDSRSDQDK